ncbi:MAG: Rossmann-like and DUF2520 domain-containing protein [Eubacterium sp.]
MKFGFIGAGKVGFSLGKYLADNGQNVSGYYSELKEDAMEASEFTDSEYYDNMEQLVEDSDVLFLTVSDGQIENVWNQLKKCHFSYQECGKEENTPFLNNKIVCHCSGALSSEVFSDIAGCGSYGYSIHPLFAVSNKYQSYKELSNSYFTIEGSSEKIDEMKTLFESFGNHVCVVSAGDKVKYHAAAAIASNLVAGLINISENLLKECGFDEEGAHKALTPIIKGNVNHILENGVVDALTGPIERNDTETVRKHLFALEEKIRKTYIAVSRQVLEIAKIKNKDRDYSKMEEILK